MEREGMRHVPQEVTHNQGNFDKALHVVGRILSAGISTLVEVGSKSLKAADTLKQAKNKINPEEIEEVPPNVSPYYILRGKQLHKEIRERNRPGSTGK